MLLAFASVLPSQAQNFNVPADATVTEGNTLTAQVTVDAAPGANITVDYAVLPKATCSVGTVNSATAGTDFVVASGTLTFLSGSTASQPVSVQTLEDSIRENADQAQNASECFQLVISNASGGTIVDDDQEIVIVDDESNPTLSIADGSAAENAGTIPMTITLSGPIDEDLTFGTNAGTPDIAFIDGSTDADNGAGGSDDTDYNDGDGTGLAAYTAVLAAGTTSTDLLVQIIDDLVYEGTETFNVQVATNARYSLSDGIGVATILDNESQPELSISDASPVAEGANLTFTVTPSVAAEASYTALFSYQDVTTTAGADYTPTPSLSITSAVTPSAPATLTVVTINDSDAEGDESLIVTITDGADYDVNAGNGNAIGLINANDSIDLSVAVNITDATINLDGTPGATVNVVVTNNGVAAATADITLTITETGFNMSTATASSYTGDSSGNTTCDSSPSLQGGSCVLQFADFGAGESETVVFTVNADGAAGSTASMTVSQAGNTETDNSNDADTDSALLVGVDFGDLTTSGGAALGSHLISSDLRLGTAIDAETSNPNDDGDGDDGVSILGNVMTANTTAYFHVQVTGGSGYLSIFGDGAITDVTDLAVTEGSNWVAVSVAVGATNPEILRFRLCSTIDNCDDATETANDGEVEDYSIAVGAAPTSVTLPTGTVEPVTVSEVGGNLTLVDGNGNTMLSATYGTGSDPDFTINGNANANTLAVSLGGLDPNLDLLWDGGDGADALEINDPNNNTWTSTHVAVSSSAGQFTFGSGGTTLGVDYQNLAPVLSTITVSDATFTFSDAIDDNIVLRDNASSVDGMSFIDSNGSEAITFKTPTTTLVINAGDGADTVDFQGLDETGSPSTTITINGEEGADTLTILPISNSSSLSLATVAGSTPTTCAGDVLDMNTSGGATIDTITNAGGTGTITFSSAHKTVSFSGIESFADQSADLSLAMSSSAGTSVNPGDQMTITMTVTNAGPDTATCVTVDDILFGSDGASGTVLEIVTGPTFSVGSYNSSTGVWSVGAMGSGDSATITYTAIVKHIFNGTATATVSSPESDPDSTDDSVSLTVAPAFSFPTGAQATSAAWYSSGTNERLVVGLANGFSGLNSAVLCRVKQITGFPADLWRECGNGLPYPLYVNDMYLDNAGTPADSTDDKLYLASWGSDGLYISTDGGENFTAAEPDLGNGTPGWTNVYSILEDNSGFLYVSANDGLVFRSLNNGATWQQVSSLPAVSTDTPWSMAAHPTEAGRLYAGTFGGGVFTSEDFGFTWTELGGTVINNLLISNNAGHIFDLELLPSSNATSGFIFAATGSGVYRMSLDGDGLATGLWSQIDTDVTLDSGTVTPEARSLAFDQSEDLYVTTWGHGAFTSSAPSTASSMSSFALRGANVTFVTISPSGGEVLMGVQEGGIHFMPAASVSTDVEPEPTTEVEIPTGYALDQNYPNPFNPVTTIAFSLPQTGTARLAVYDVLGREVEVLIDGTVQAGQHEVQFDAAGLPTGTYIYRLETKAGSFTKQLVLMK
ncbi:MAG: T9SS type A sorting domain-containing protein [Rhodothermales bacterium]|nr:T9SS type A sorting domain-containing protein [Rhodothermales bacterium]